jgi:predicted dehydrogenase
VNSKPDWSAEIGDAAKTGGPAVDLHIHDTHFVCLLCGVPKRVFASGRSEKGAVTYLTTQYLYGRNGPAVSCCSGAVSQKGREFAHGFEIYLEKATLSFNSAGCPLTVYDAAGKTTQPRLAGGPDPTGALTAEIQAAVDGVRTGKEPDLLRGKLARNALVLCHKECRSVRTGKAIAV